MNIGLKKYLHKKATENNLHLTINNNEITLHNAKPRQYLKFLDVLVTLGYPVKSHIATRNQHGQLIDILTI